MKEKKVIKFKICLLGNPGVGKTSLIQKYVHDFFGDVYIRTMGTKVSRKGIQISAENDQGVFDVTMMIWDIMGQKIPSVLHKTYFKFAKGSFIVCDVTRKNTLLDCEDWVTNLYEVTGEIPIIFMANKNDLQEKKAFMEDDLKTIADRHNSPFYFSSAKTGENVNRAFHQLGKMMLNNALRESREKKPVKATSQQETGLEANIDHDRVGPVPEVIPGGSYMLKEEKPIKSFQIFKHLVASGGNGICITRRHPNMIRNEYHIDNVSMHWLTSGEQDDTTIDPKKIDNINDVISNFIRKNSNSIVLLEGVEYLIRQNDFKTIMDLINSINDAVMGSSSIFILTLDPFILEKRELHIIGRDLSIIS